MINISGPNITFSLLDSRPKEISERQAEKKTEKSTRENNKAQETAFNLSNREVLTIEIFDI